MNTVTLLFSNLIFRVVPIFLRANRYQEIGRLSIESLKSHKNLIEEVFYIPAVQVKDLSPRTNSLSVSHFTVTTSPDATGNWVEKSAIPGYSDLS